MLDNALAGYIGSVRVEDAALQGYVLRPMILSECNFCGAMILFHDVVTPGKRETPRQRCTDYTTTRVWSHQELEKLPKRTSALASQSPTSIRSQSVNWSPVSVTAAMFSKSFEKTVLFFSDILYDVVSSKSKIYLEFFLFIYQPQIRNKKNAIQRNEKEDERKGK